MRTTPKQLQATVARIVRNHGVDIGIEWAYGRPRITNANQSRDISPRLPTGEMLQWLFAFECGLNMASNKATQI
jgi:hypothetical protein